MSQSQDEIRQHKQAIRDGARESRNRHPDKDRLSLQICRRLAELPEYRSAGTVMFYVDIRAEVRTQHFLPTVWQNGKQMVVPYWAEGRLELFRVEGFDELAPGTYSILEPTAQWRERADRRVDISQIDLVVVPGVAFDRRGGRIGRGKGYYDKLLRTARPESTFVALAFECQLVDKVPMQDHDVYMHKVITEARVYNI